MAKSQDIEKFLTLEELAEMSGFSVKYLRKAKAELGLPSYKFGRMLRFKMSEFIEWANQRRTRVS